MLAGVGGGPGATLGDTGVDWRRLSRAQGAAARGGSMAKKASEAGLESAADSSLKVVSLA